MIEAIEAALRHWGEQLHGAASEGGLGSMMGTIIEYGGAAPRGGVPGARILSNGTGPDDLASEVAAALATIGRTAKDGTRLIKLARVRDFRFPELPLADQIYDLELIAGPSGERSYYRHLDRLHECVSAELAIRAERLHRARIESRREGDKMRNAAQKQARGAHKALGARRGNV